MTADTSARNPDLPFPAMLTERVFLMAAWAFLALGSAAPAQLSPAQAARQWEDARAFTALPALEDDQAAQNFQNAFIERLSGQLGRPVGYKAALTEARAQQRFGVSQPILGVLLERMLLEDAAGLPLDYAARPVAEADLLVRVSDPNINAATTDLELLAGLDVAFPFIELADLLLAPGTTGDVRALTALNVGARAGIRGAAIPLAADQATLDRLASFSVRLVDQDGQVLGEGRGEALLGHPIHVVRWIRDTLKARGDELRMGELLSLGALTAPLPLVKPVRLTARYEGLQDGAAASVSCNLLEPGPGTGN